MSAAGQRGGFRLVQPQLLANAAQILADGAPVLQHQRVAGLRIALGACLIVFDLAAGTAAKAGQALDIRHQLTIMQLARRYCEAGGGVIAVMHDLNLTAMFADHMVMMKAGRIERAGRPADVMTDDAMEAVFGCRMRINGVPAAGVPFVLPHTATA